MNIFKSFCPNRKKKTWSQEKDAYNSHANPSRKIDNVETTVSNAIESRDIINEVSEDDDNSDVAKDRLRRDAIGPKASTTCVGASYFCCSLNLISNGMEDNSLDVVIASFRTFRALIESKRTNPLFSNDPNDCLEDCRHIRKSLKIITPKILKRLDIKCPGVLRNLAQTCALSLAKASVMDGLVIVMPFLGDIEISPYARLSALYILILEFGISNTRGSPIQCKIATTLLEPALKDTNEHLIRKAIAVIIAMTRFVDLDVILTHVRDIGPDALDIVTKKNGSSEENFKPRCNI
mmetsp:Transcript_56049/g.67564  ORF Transcript_56049/g.67564 Transcript_56049/m.67564 type:complete len:293 (+) Transcript_56049:83-961(+)